MPTYPQAVIPVFPAGNAPLPAAFTAWVRQPLQFLTQVPLFRGQQQAVTPQSLAAGFQALSMDTVLEDPYGGWSAAGTGAQAASSWLVPYTGYYEVTVTCSIAAAALWCAAGVQVSGGTAAYGDMVLVPGSTEGGCSASLTVPCIGGQDYIQGGAYVSTAATTDTSSAGRYPAIEIAYVSGG